ncbi:Glutamine synthetase [bioreactor metagenome]|uniref:Glutamine synthetase n=1 Tax=bioreactor metagenome TaxID=1076179 RepID=A0A645G4L3_9ZZZZ
MLNLKSTIEALPELASKKNELLYEKYKIFTKSELHSRYEILIENYSKTINIEALTMLEMAKREILPACLEFTTTILTSLSTKKSSGLLLNTAKEEQLAVTLSSLTEELMTQIDELDSALINAKDLDDALSSAKYYRENVFTAMNTMRLTADKLETIVSSDYWPFPTYSELLFLV